MSGDFFYYKSQVEAFFPSVFFYFILCFHSLTEYTDKEKEQNSFLLSKRLRDLKVLEYTEQLCKCIAIESEVIKYVL